MKLPTRSASVCRCTRDSGPKNTQAGSSLEIFDRTRACIWRRNHASRWNKAIRVRGRNRGTHRRVAAGPRRLPFHPSARRKLRSARPVDCECLKWPTWKNWTTPSIRPRKHSKCRLACLRQMSPGERIRQTLAMSRRLRNMAMDAIRRRHPDWGDAEVGLMFIELNYGKSLADDIRRRRAERAS